MAYRNVIVGLAAVLIAYLALVNSQASPAWFGYYHDDSLYWTAARSLAEGEGYRMVSVPGEPPQTKYPVAFPLLLSAVWRLQPEFPANLALAQWVVAGSGAVFLAGAFVLLMQLGLGRGAALFLTAVCALHPVIVHLGGQLLSDIPFMAVAVWSLVFAHGAIERHAAPGAMRWWLAALALAAVGVSIRSIGVAVLAGIALAAGARRAYGPAAACLVILAALLLAPALAAVERSAAVASVETTGYEQTIQFYTSYLGFWKLSTPDWPTLKALLIFNLRELVKQPSVFVFMLPASGYAAFGWQVTAMVVSCAIFKGMGGIWKLSRHPAFVVLAGYAVVLLLWNYTLMDRFLAWALPLFLAGAWWEIRRVIAATRGLFESRAPLLDRTLSSAVLVGATALCLYAGYRYLWLAPQTLAAKRQQRDAVQTEKQQAYAWIRQNTAPADRFIASEDASLYLFTGRQALRPMAFSTAAFYLRSKELLSRDLDQMTDTACQIRARYWLAASDDYHLESAQKWIQKRSREVLERRDAVFVSRGGDVRIYDIAALTAGDEDEQRSCPSRPVKHSDG